MNTIPRIVRMLTTAYSELGEAIEAINTGEIYRYITKPWDMTSLHADLRNALELAQLRNERDHLMRGEKLIVQQQQLLGNRAGQLALACAGFLREDSANAVHVFLETALAAGCPAPAIDWRALDYADVVQAEAAPRHRHRAATGAVARGIPRHGLTRRGPGRAGPGVAGTSPAGRR